MKTIKILSSFYISGSPNDRRVHAKLAEDAIVGGFHTDKGETITTSKVKMIDFERKYLITQNTTYFWE